MQSIIIIALVLLWLAVTLFVGCLMEAASAEIRKLRKKRKLKAIAERNIILFKNRGGESFPKIIPEQ